MSCANIFENILEVIVGVMIRMFEKWYIVVEIRLPWSPWDVKWGAANKKASFVFNEQGFNYSWSGWQDDDPTP